MSNVFHTSPSTTMTTTHHQVINSRQGDSSVFNENVYPDFVRNELYRSFGDFDFTTIPRVTFRDRFVWKLKHFGGVRQARGYRGWEYFDLSIRVHCVHAELWRSRRAQGDRAHSTTTRFYSSIFIIAIPSLCPLTDRAVLCRWVVSGMGLMSTARVILEGNLKNFYFKREFISSSRGYHICYTWILLRLIVIFIQFAVFNIRALFLKVYTDYLNWLCRCNIPGKCPR